MVKSITSIFVTFFAIYLLLGCVEKEYTWREPFYINNSGVNAKLIVDCSDRDRDYCESEIKNNDTLCNYYLNQENCATDNWVAPSDNSNDDFIRNSKGAIYFKIEFFNEPKICLIFEGDAKIGENDIRYWENYIKMEESSNIRQNQSLSDHSWIYIPYYYTITPDLMQHAKEEFCEKAG